MKVRGLLAASVLGLWGNTCLPSAGLTGFVHTVHTNHQSNMVHVYLEGPLTFNEPGCSSYWTGNSMDDTKFLTITYPLLVVALAKRLQVNITVDGCLNGYPKIFAIDLVPR
jgi:hypothetical protein